MNIFSDVIFKARIWKHLVKSARERGQPWRNVSALSATVSDVLSMDADLLAYVRDFLDGKAMEKTDVRCEAVSVKELVDGCGYDAINAALVIQWFRREPRAASAFLAQHDGICHLPAAGADEIPDDLRNV